MVEGTLHHCPAGQAATGPSVLEGGSGGGSTGFSGSVSAGPLLT
jgi:hypothetical protein